MPRSFAAIRPYFYLLVLAWINVYICREAFHTEATGHFNSMHGEWIALARMGDYGWWRASWWPWWGAGAPLEFTYTPLVPALTAFLSWVSHGSLALSFNQLSGAVFCLAPVVMYLVSWKISGSAGYSFIAGVACSLLSPFELIVPDDNFRWSALRFARRMMLIFEWDDLPHLVSITLLPVVLWFLWRALERRRVPDFALAGLGMVLMMLANPFGMVLIAFTVITLPLAMGPAARVSNLARGVITAVCAWIVVSPWMTPSLLLTIQRNSVLDHESASMRATLIALGITALVCAGVYLIARRQVESWGGRWLALFGTIVLLVPILDHFAGLRFLPQPGRYKVEADFLVPWIAVFLLRPLAQRAPASVRVVLVLPLLLASAVQVKNFRHEAKWRMLRSIDPTESVEYRAATWLASNLPDQRVMMPGSTGQWADAFGNVPQVGGQQYPTAPNVNQQTASYIIGSGDGAGDQDAAISILWLKAFGARAVVVPGPESPEFWHPFRNPRKFDGVLPVLWRDRDTTAYQVSNGAYSLAHVLRPADLVQHQPIHGLDVAEIRQYVAAIEDPAAPAATLTWHGNDDVTIDARAKAGDVVSAQITWDRGWHARVNGTARPIHRDGLGLIAVDAGCAGECRIELEYDGGVERRVCRFASIGLPVFLLIAALRRRARKRLT